METGLAASVVAELVVPAAPNLAGKHLAVSLRLRACTSMLDLIPFAACNPDQSIAGP